MSAWVFSVGVWSDVIVVNSSKLDSEDKGAGENGVPVAPCDGNPFKCNFPTVLIAKKEFHHMPLALVSLLYLNLQLNVFLSAKLP